MFLFIYFYFMFYAAKPYAATLRLEAGSHLAM